MSFRIRLGVNIDHVATLRQVRLARYPDIVEALHLCERGGADQITVHLREDRRHIQDDDVRRLLEASLLPINLEMAWTAEMISFAQKSKPFSVTLVPERREEMTTEKGLDLKQLSTAQSRKRLLQLKRQTRLHAFIDGSLEQVKRALDLGFDGVEFHTGHYAELFEQALRGRKAEALWRAELKKLMVASELAHHLELEVKAGHGLTIQNIAPIRQLVGLAEVNIGHSIVARAILMGLEAAVAEMRRKIDQAA
jgi:pyridoxine 5-phosphate synthase